MEVDDVLKERHPLAYESNVTDVFPWFGKLVSCFYKPDMGEHHETEEEKG